jgi:hypothetical protein
MRSNYLRSDSKNSRVIHIINTESKIHKFTLWISFYTQILICQFYKLKINMKLFPVLRF